MIIYVINILYDGLTKLNNIKKKSEILKDAAYISNLGNINKRHNNVDIHQKLLSVVERINKYYVPYEDMMNIIKKLLLNIHNQWIVDKYQEFFYKYICKDRIEAVYLISRNLLAANELAVIS